MLPDDIVRQLQIEKQRLEDTIYKSQLRIREIDKMIEFANKTSFNWSVQALDCIKKAFEPLMTSDILQAIFVYDIEQLQNQNKRRHYIMQLSLALNRLCARGEISSISISGIRGKFYYPSEWESDKGTLKPEYNYRLQHRISKITITKKRLEYE